MSFHYSSHTSPEALPPLSHQTPYKHRKVTSLLEIPIPPKDRSKSIGAVKIYHHYHRKEPNKHILHKPMAQSFDSRRPIIIPNKGGKTAIHQAGLNKEKARLSPIELRKNIDEFFALKLKSSRYLHISTPQAHRYSFKDTFYTSKRPCIKLFI